MSDSSDDRPACTTYRTRDGRVYEIFNGRCRLVLDGNVEVESSPFLGLPMLGGVAANNPTGPAEVVAVGRRIRFKKGFSELLTEVVVEIIKEGFAARPKPPPLPLKRQSSANQI